MTDVDSLRDRIARLEAEVAGLRTDNARLRRLLDGKGVPDALRHAFRDTVVTLRAIMRRTSTTARDVESYDARLGGRLDAIVRVRNNTDAFGEADLHSIVCEELASFVLREGQQVTLAGPGVRLLPRAAEVFGLAMHELTTNAVEHGPLNAAAGRLSVAWSIVPGEAGSMLALDWKETGAAGAVAPSRRGFGTTVVEDMLGYEFGAEATLSYEADGLRCRIRLPLDARTGHPAGSGDGAEGSPLPR